MKLSYKFSLAIVAVTMTSLIILGAIFSVYATGVIKTRIYDQLKSVSTLKENQLNNYINRSMNGLEALASDPSVVEYMEHFHGASNSDGKHNLTLIEEDLLKSPNLTSSWPSELISEVSAAANLPESLDLKNMDLEKLEASFENSIAEHFQTELLHSEFSSLSVLTTEGVVDLSTEPDEKGKIKSAEKYFINGINSTYVQSFYISISTREPTMTMATPVFDDKHKVVGVLTGDIRLNQISNIMVERSGLGTTGETIIINKNHLLVSESRFLGDIAFKKTIYSSGLNECLAGNDGEKEYKDYRNQDVIGYLKWMPEREICLVTKIDRNEVYDALKSLYWLLLAFGIILLVSSLLMAYALSMIFTRSINELVGGTEQWSKGNLNYTIPVNSNDEIAILCKAFNDASQEMLKSKEFEKNYTKDLKRELDKKTLDLRKNVEELEKSKKASLNIMDDLSESNKHLQDLDKAKTDFLNVASHELKTPLTVISAYLEILDDYKGQFNKDQLQGLDAIKRNSNQLKTLIGNILEISRLDSGRFDLNISDVDIKEKVISLVDNLKILSDNKHIKLKYDCDGVGVISTDAMRFEEILNNLVGNAIKFTEKGSVTVKTEYGTGKEKGFIVVSVIDTGVGIAEDKMNNLFQKFYQVDATISRKYGGTGLGLSITKKMIELQDGKISVSSSEGKGTTFRFTLPIKPSTKSISKADSKVKSKTDELYTAAGKIIVDKTDTKVDIKADVKTDVKAETATKTKIISKTDNIKTHSNSKPLSKSISKQINRHTHTKKK